MDGLRYTLEIQWIRIRGLFWTILQLLALGAVVLGALRLFAPIVEYTDEPVARIVVMLADATAPIPKIGPATYMFGGLVATLVISWLR